MGANLVAAVYTYAPGRISPRAFIVLGRMALTVPDSHAEPTYFGGADPLARALGMEPGTESATRAITRAMRELVDQGLIEQVRGQRSHNRRWLLTINPNVTVDDLATPGVQETLLSLVENPVDDEPGGDVGVPSRPDTHVRCDRTPMSGVTGHPRPSDRTPVSTPEEEEEEGGTRRGEEITVGEHLTQRCADLASKRLATGDGS